MDLVKDKPASILDVYLLDHDLLWLSIPEKAWSMPDIPDPAILVCLCFLYWDTSHRTYA
jgi:hypothetical protein